MNHGGAEAQRDKAATKEDGKPIMPALQRPKVFDAVSHEVRAFRRVEALHTAGWKLPCRNLALVDTVALRLCLPARAGTWDVANTAGMRTKPTPLRSAGRRSPRSARTATRRSMASTEQLETCATRVRNCDASETRFRNFFILFYLVWAGLTWFHLFLRRP